MTVPDPEASSLDANSAQARRLRLVLAAATLAMVLLSWPLWIDLDDFPAVPLIRGFPDYPREWSWLGLGLIVAGLGLALTERLGKLGLGATVGIMTWLILGDQLRLQPWAYQFLVMGTILAALPPRSALAFCRAYLVSVYLYSGLSKLDRSFVDEMGPLFLRTLARFVPFDASGLSRPGREAWALVMPIGEIAVALLLAFRSTRRLGYIGALLTHVLLLLILGPWGLGHSTIVLVWNVAMAAEEFLAFWPSGSGMDWGWREKAIGLPFALVLILPIGERWGLLDSWPSHALYASHCEQSLISMRDERDDRELPDALRIARARVATPGVWLLKPTDWTRAVRGVPAYPQRRYADGLAEWIALRRGDDPDASSPEVWVDHRLRADPWTGRRDATRSAGLAGIREEGKRFRFNASPRRRDGR